MKKLLLLVVVVGIAACGGSPEPPPEPPPPPTTTTTVEPPPPPPPVEPEDYITITRAGELGEKDAQGNYRCVTGAGLLQELCFYEQVLIWDGIRNPEYALVHCCSKLPGPWGFLVINNGGKCTSPDIDANKETHQELIGYMQRLQEVNKRCPALPRFCGRTNVQREYFSDWREEMLEPAMDISENLNGIKAWCEKQ